MHGDTTTDTVRQAAQIVRQGGVIAYPTEAVYGLGCDPRNEAAVTRLLRIKQRDVAQGLILIGRSLADFSIYIQPLQDEISDKLLASWPGSVTWLVPASADCPNWLCGQHETLAIRVTAHQQTRELCTAAGMVLVSTSANRSGEPAATAESVVRKMLADEIDYILGGQTDGHNSPSQIRDALTDALVRE